MGNFFNFNSNYEKDIIELLFLYLFSFPREETQGAAFEESIAPVDLVLYLECSDVSLIAGLAVHAKEREIIFFIDRRHLSIASSIGKVHVQMITRKLLNAELKHSTRTTKRFLPNMLPN